MARTNWRVQDKRAWVLINSKYLIDWPGLIQYLYDYCILGLDPSLNGFGAAYLNHHEDGPFMGGVCLGQQDENYTVGEKLLNILDMFVNDEGMIGKLYPNIVCYESITASTSFQGLVGVAQASAAMKMGIEKLYEKTRYRPFVIPIVSSQIKKFATGNGRCKTKQEVIDACLDKWKFETDNDNIADAFVAAKVGECVFDIAFHLNQDLNWCFDENYFEERDKELLKYLKTGIYEAMCNGGEHGDYEEYQVSTALKILERPNFSKEMSPDDYNELRVGLLEVINASKSKKPKKK